jgi:predicted RNA-binding Zn ribbon-like protein
MRHSKGRAIFIADSVGLDFLNSVATRDGQRVEWLGSGADFLAWLNQSKLVPLKILESVREQGTLGELDRVADKARRLREWFREFVHARKGRRIEVTDLRDLEPLNDLLARDEGFSQLVPRVDGKAPELHTLRRWRLPDMLLLPVAEALARVVSEEDFTHVKVCEGPSCTLMFADRMHRHARRWCSQEICGNRAKQAAYQKRMRSNRKKQAIDIFRQRALELDRKLSQTKSEESASASSRRRARYVDQESSPKHDRHLGKDP